MRSALFWDLRNVEWKFLTDVSEQPIGPIKQSIESNEF
jgi:hypothetical protein